MEVEQCVKAGLPGCQGSQHLVSKIAFQCLCASPRAEHLLWPMFQSLGMHKHQNTAPDAVLAPLLLAATVLHSFLAIFAGTTLCGFYLPRLKFSGFYCILLKLTSIKLKTLTGVLLSNQQVPWIHPLWLSQLKGFQVFQTRVGTCLPLLPHVLSCLASV